MGACGAWKAAQASHARSLRINDRLTDTTWVRTPLALCVLAAIALSAVETPAGAAPSTPDTAGTIVEDPIELEFVPGELWMDPIPRGRSRALTSATGEFFRLRNASGHRVTVELSVLPLAESAEVICPGYIELLANGSVRLAVTRVVLAPGESRALAGAVRAGRLRGRPTGHRACLIAARPVEGARQAAYAVLYVRTH